MKRTIILLCCLLPGIIAFGQNPEPPTQEWCKWAFGQIPEAAEFIQSLGDISQNVIWGGVKVGLIPTTYGIIVYIVSLVLRIIKKPRI